MRVTWPSSGSRRAPRHGSAAMPSGWRSSGAGGQLAEYVFEALGLAAHLEHLPALLHGGVENRLAQVLATRCVDVQPGEPAVARHDVHRIDVAQPAQVCGRITVGAQLDEHPLFAGRSGPHVALRSVENLLALVDDDDAVAHRL